MSNRSSKEYLLAVAFPATGHVIPMLTLLKQLHDLDRTLHIKFLVSNCCAKQLLGSSVFPEKYFERIRVISLRDGLSENDIRTDVTGATFCAGKTAMDPALDEKLNELLLGITGLLWDFHVPRAAEILRENYRELIPSYCFVASLGSIARVWPEFDKYLDVIDGNSAEFESYTYWLQDRNFRNSYQLTKPHADIIFKCSRNMSASTGIILNSYLELDRQLTTFSYINERDPVWFVGPLVDSATDTRDLEEWNRIQEWLYLQPESSVVFADLGASTGLSSEQLEHLVNGLLGSNRPFVLSLDQLQYEALLHHKSRKLMNRIAASFAPSPEAKFLILPRTPQKAMLAHANVGLFVTHCDWNSVLQAIVSGKPIVGWPVTPSQFANASLVEQRGMGVRLKGLGFVTDYDLTDAIQRAGGLWAKRNSHRVRSSYRDQARLMQREARVAVDENGSSAKAFRRFSGSIFSKLVTK